MADIRRATAADLDAMVEIGRELVAEAPNYRDEPFEPEVMRRWFADRIGGTFLGSDGVAFVAERGGQLVGLLVAMTVPRWFNRHRVGCELVLYVRPEHRGGRAFPKLVRAYKDWARSQGVVKAYMGVSTGLHPQRTVHAYEKLGGKLDGYNVVMDL